jgi:ribosomal protein S18 acetylase RimI-like enzyme
MEGPLSEYSIRNATPDDAEEIARLHVAASLKAYGPIFGPQYTGGDPAERTEMWRRMLMQDHTLAWTPPEKTYVAMTPDESIAGFCAVGASRDDDTPDDGEVYMVYVAPDHWKGGVGRKLFDSGVKYLKTRQFDRLTLWVLKDNVRARTFYERAGWIPEGKEKPSFSKPDLSQVRYRLVD